jgi:antitoxin VapB
MARTRAFRSGNSQAVRIPADMAYADTEVDLEINRHGDVIVIAPVRRSMKEAVAELRAMQKPSGIEPREAIEVPVRPAD